MSKIHLWPEDIYVSENTVKISCTVTISNQSKFKLWYRFPIKYQDCLAGNSDPFVLATILLAMTYGYDLIVHSQVSSCLLDNLEEFQDAWCCWPLKKYKKISIQADQEKTQEKNLYESCAITAFSGGLDSCFTAFRHQREDFSRQKRNLKAGLMVHGFDIPINQEGVFNKSFERSQIITSSLGLDLIPMTTNFRQVINLNWEEVFNTALASCLHCLSKGYGIGIIPASTYYTKMDLPSAFDPITDSFLSSSNFQIINDGSAFTRLQKTEQMLNWQEFKDHLRVCWQGEYKYKNCGKCEKCTRTILTFRILNKQLPSCFEEDVTDRQIFQLKLKGLEIGTMQSLMEQIKARDQSLLSESWVKTLQIVILRNRIKEFIKKGVYSPVKHMFKKVYYLFIKKNAQKN